MATFFRELSAVRSSPELDTKISKTAAYLLHWIKYDRSDLPKDITHLSFKSYTEPVTEDGNAACLPVWPDDEFQGFEEKEH